VNLTEKEDGWYEEVFGAVSGVVRVGVFGVCSGYAL